MSELQLVSAIVCCDVSGVYVSLVYARTPVHRGLLPGEFCTVMRVIIDLILCLACCLCMYIHVLCVCFLCHPPSRDTAV